MIGNAESREAPTGWWWDAATGSPMLKDPWMLVDLAAAVATMLYVIYA